MNRKIISFVVVVAIICSLSAGLSLNFIAESEILSGYTKATTSAQISAANTAKTSLQNSIQYYRNYYTRVTIADNRQKASVIAYKNELNILEELLTSSTLYLASYYSTEGTGNIEALWQTFRLELPMSNGLIKMRDDYRDLKQPGLDFTSSGSSYTTQTWNALITTVNNMDNIKNTCTDAEGLAAYNNYKAAIDALVKANSSVTQAQIDAKNNLDYLLDYYITYAGRVTLDKYKSNSEYQNYINNILPAAQNLIASSTYYSVSTYTNMENSLENSWSTWRLSMPISSGLYAFRDKILATVGSSSQYDAAAWANYQSSLPAIHSMIDNTKNSLTATDADGESVLATLQAAVDNLKNPSTQTPEDIAAKQNLASSLEAYRTQTKRDTKTVKSPETVTLNNMIDAALQLVASTTAKAAEYNQALSDLETYLKTVFMPALFIGQPFIEAARKIYYVAAKQWRSYTTESWKAVSNAINNCDAVKGSGTDVQSAAAYASLQSAIANLKNRQAGIADLTVSTATGKPGDTITININIGAGSGIIYGNFNLLYDNTVLEFISASESHAQNQNNKVYYNYENPTPLTSSKNILSITFKIKAYAQGGNSSLTLTADKLRDNGGYLVTPQISNGFVSVDSSYIRGNVSCSGELSTTDARKILTQAITNQPATEEQIALADYNKDGSVNTTDARKVLRAVVGIENSYTVMFDTQGSGDIITPIQSNQGNIISTPSQIPTKSGYVFDGWYTMPQGQGVKSDGSVLLTRDQTLYASWKEFKAGALTQDKIQFGGYVAIHNAYAVEDDFKMLADCGITIIILDYDRTNKERSDRCLAWSEKYGIKAYIHDYDLNALSSFTTAKVLQYTADYRNSPSFAGNNLFDEPSNTQFSTLQAYASVYKQALPAYDMHINLFPNYGVTSLIGISYQTYLNQYISTVTSCDHISQDPYPFSNSNGTKNVYSEYYTGLLQMANIAKTKNLDYWIYPQILTGMENYFPDLDDIRFQIYSGLAFGASKFMQYCYHVPGYNGVTYSAEVYAMRDYAGAYTELWDYGQYVQNEVLVFSDIYQQYNWQSAGAYKTGTVPSYLSSVSTFSSTVLTSLSSNQNLVIGSFNAKSGSSKAFMITNAANLNNNASATVSFKASGTVTAYVDGMEHVLSPVNGVYTISLKVAQGAFITIA